MASRTSRLLQDQNFGVFIDGKANFTGQKKTRGAGVRKPLGDVSNSGKPSIMNQAGGKKTQDASFISGKQLKSQTSNRKALSDISNSGNLKTVGEIKTKSSLKLSAIAEEQCLHNHQECIKSQSEPMSLRHLFKIVGLENDSDDPLAVSSGIQEFNELKPKSDPEHLDLEEVPEKLPEVESSWKDPFLATENGSPTRCLTPKNSGCHKLWDDIDVNFKLIETPQLPKI